MLVHVHSDDVDIERAVFFASFLEAPMPDAEPFVELSEKALQQRPPAAPDFGLLVGPAGCVREA